MSGGIRRVRKCPEDYDALKSYCGRRIRLIGMLVKKLENIGFLSPPEGVKDNVFFSHGGKVKNLVEGGEFSYVVWKSSRSDDYIATDLRALPSRPSSPPLPSPRESHYGPSFNSPPLLPPRESPCDPSSLSPKSQSRSSRLSGELFDFSRFPELYRFLGTNKRARGQVCKVDFNGNPLPGFVFVRELNGTKPWGKDVFIPGFELGIQQRTTIIIGAKVEFRVETRGDGFVGRECHIIEDDYDNQDRNDQDRYDQGMKDRDRNEARCGQWYEEDRHRRSAPNGGRYEESMYQGPDRRERGDRMDRDRDRSYRDRQNFSTMDRNGRDMSPRRSEGLMRANAPMPSSTPSPAQVEFVQIVKDWVDMDADGILIPQLRQDDVVEVLMRSEDRCPPKWAPPAPTGWLRVKKGFVSTWIPTSVVESQMVQGAVVMDENRGRKRGAHDAEEGGAGVKRRKGNWWEQPFHTNPKRNAAMVAAKFFGPYPGQQGVIFSPIRNPEGPMVRDFLAKTFHVNILASIAREFPDVFTFKVVGKNNKMWFAVKPKKPKVVDLSKVDLSSISKKEAAKRVAKLFGPYPGKSGNIFNPSKQTSEKEGTAEYKKDLWKVLKMHFADPNTGKCVLANVFKTFPNILRPVATTADSFYEPKPPFDVVGKVHTSLDWEQRRRERLGSENNTKAPRPEDEGKKVEVARREDERKKAAAEAVRLEDERKKADRARQAARQDKRKKANAARIEEERRRDAVGTEPRKSLGTQLVDEFLLTFATDGSDESNTPQSPSVTVADVLWTQYSDAKGQEYWTNGSVSTYEHPEEAERQRSEKLHEVPSEQLRDL